MRCPVSHCVAADSSVQSTGGEFESCGRKERLAHNTKLHPEVPETRKVTKKAYHC